MTKLRTLSIILCLVLAVMVVAGACGTPAPSTSQPSEQPSNQPSEQPAKTPKVFKYGQIVSMTGPMSVSFKGMYDGAKPAAELINSMDGIQVGGETYNVEFVSADDKSTSAGAVSAYSQLRQQNIDFILAPPFIANNMAIAQQAEADKVLRIGPVVIDVSQFGPDYPYSFNALCTLYQIPPAYEWLVENYPDVKKVAMCRIDDPGAALPEQICIKEAETRGLEVVANETYMIGTEDLFPIVTKILQSEPDAIDMVLTLTPLAKGIIEGARQMGFEGPIFMGAPIGDINDLMGMLNPEYAHDIFSGSPDVLSSSMTPLLQEFRPMIEKAQGRSMYMDNIFPLGSIYLLKQVIEKAQSFDTTVVRDTWLNITEIDTMYGPGEMTGMELVGSNCVVLPDKLSYTYIMDGKLQAFSLDSIPFAK
jgi:ABC-type branched-subunit amino acid transport system substrate-binding protein